MNTRQQIIEATERIIQARGLARTTTKEIAREAGFAEGTLYKHFQSKEDLILAVVAENLPHVLEALQEHQPGSKTVRENLTGILLAVIAYYDKLVPLAASFFADIELLTRYRAWMEETNAGPMRLHERIATYVQGEQHLGRLQIAQEPDVVAALLLGPCFQYVFNRHFLLQYPQTLQYPRADRRHEGDQTSSQAPSNVDHPGGKKPQSAGGIAADSDLFTKTDQQYVEDLVHILMAGLSAQ